MEEAERLRRNDNYKLKESDLSGEQDESNGSDESGEDGRSIITEWRKEE